MAAGKKTKSKPKKKPNRPSSKRSSALAKKADLKKTGRPAGKQTGISTVKVLTINTKSLPPEPARVFSIRLDSISGDTTIGDLIVAFPRTRDVLIKHGLRFDVEQAGYLYMTLNVFSAIHGLASNTLIQEIQVVSKEPPIPPPILPLRPVPAPAT